MVKEDIRFSTTRVGFNESSNIFPKDFCGTPYTRVTKGIRLCRFGGERIVSLIIDFNLDNGQSSLSDDAILSLFLFLDSFSPE